VIEVVDLKGNLCKTCKYNNNCKPCVYDIVVGYRKGGKGTIVSCIRYMRISKTKGVNEK